MIISIRGPSHGPQMGAICGCVSTSKESYGKYLIQSSCLLLRLVSYLTIRQSCPLNIASRMDQRSIVLFLHLTALSAHAVHDDLAAALGRKAMASSRVTCYLREARLGMPEVTLDSEPSSSHFTSMISTGLSWQPLTKRRAVFTFGRTCPSRARPMRCRLSLKEGSPNRSRSHDVFLHGCPSLCQTLRR
jgi:hypothetical protein